MGIFGLGGRRRHQRQAVPKILTYKIVPHEMMLQATVTFVVIHRYATGSADETSHANGGVSEYQLFIF
jgi:hypothetical protein